MAMTRPRRTALAMCRLWLLLMAAALAGQPAFAQSGSSGPAAFEQPALNPGLGPLPDRIHRDTPQAAMESFVDATEAGDDAGAAHLLNLADVPEAEQAARGPELARRLAVVIDRNLVVDWDGLLGRPDAVDVRAPSEEPMAGEPRQSLLIGLLNLDGRPVAIRLNRVIPEGGAPAWVFSEQSVRRIDRLYARYGPSDLELALPEPVRAVAFWDLRWWEVIGLPVLAVLLIVVARSTFALLGRLARGEDRPLLRRVMRELRWPVTILLLTAILQLATARFFVVSGKIATLTGPLIAIGYVAGILLIIVSLVDAMLDEIVDDNPEDMSAPEARSDRSLATKVSAARRVVVLIAVIAGAGIVLTSANVFKTMGFSLLASAGVLTLVLGFAAREVLGNIIASLQISLNRSARIGDQVLFEGKWCTVERIHLTFVQLKIWNGNRLVVPVGRFVAEPFENWSLKDDAMVRLAKVKLASTADLEPMRRAFREFVDREDGISPKDEATSYVISQDAFGMTVRFGVPVPDPTDGWDIECRLREHMIAAARDQGVALPNEVARMDAA